MTYGGPHFSTRFTTVAAIGLLWGTLAAPLSAQDATGAASDDVGSEQPAASPAKLLLQAYEISKTSPSEEQLSEIVELCQQGLAANPNDKSVEYGKKLLAWAYNRRGEVVAEAGREEDALGDFSRAVELRPASWQYAHNRGVSHAILGNSVEAIADFDRTIELQPSFAKAYFNRGEIRYDMGQFDGAIADYNQMIRLKPRDSLAYTSRGHTYYRLQNIRSAMRDYSRAIRLDPKNAEAHTHRGDAYGDQGRFTQAANDYRTAIRVNPNYGRAYHSAAWLMATCPDQRYRNARLAVDAAKKAIELDGHDDYRYVSALAAALANAGDFEEAAELQAEVIERAPKEFVERHKSRLALYQQEQPYRDVLTDQR